MTFKIIPVAGDASFREFYRIILNKKKKIIVIAKKDKYKNLLSYIAINKFLRKNSIFAPKLYSYNYKKSFMIIEDFGDLTFYKILKKNNNKLKIYKKLINLLIKIQKIKPVKKIKNINNKFHILEKYSNQNLLKESNLFFDWYLPLFLNKKKTLTIKIKLNKILKKIYKKIHFSNSCFVHRDYHVQNLMQVERKIGIIDSQDALIGHPAYDLVSLIDDVRIKTSIKLKNDIFNYYLKRSNKIYKKKTKIFFKDFKILSVQRSLKIIGIFSRLFLRDNKKKYLKLIPYTWKLLELRLDDEVFTELRKALKTYIPSKFKRKMIYK